MLIAYVIERRVIVNVSFIESLAHGPVYDFSRPTSVTIEVSSTLGMIALTVPTWKYWVLKLQSEECILVGLRQ